MSKVVVFGGSGFIGTRLVERLVAAGNEVIIGDKVKSAKFPELWRACDVTISETLPDLLRSADVVCNLAAEHRDDVRPIQRYYDVNVRGAEVVCSEASRAGVKRLVFTSSVAVYGLPKGRTDESAPCTPFNEYGRTKLLAEGVYEKWWSENPGRALVVVRPTVVFGEGNRGNVYNLLSQIASGRFLMVGDGRNKKSLAYVENVAAFLEHGMHQGPGHHLFNYADGPDFDMNTLTAEAAVRLGRSLPRVRMPYAAGYAVGATLDLLALLSGRTFPLSAVRVRKFCASTEFSADRAFASGFRPAVTLEEGIKRVVESDFRPQVH